MQDLNSDDKNAWMKKVEAIASEVAEREGCVLYDMEFQGTGNGRVLRIYIDKEPSVGIDDCSNVSHGLNEKLDSDDIIPGGMYNLEVSTPGLDRRLNRPWHFEKAVGKKIWLKTSKAFGELGVTLNGINKNKQIEGVLENVTDGKLVFKNKEGEFQIPIDGIEKAHVVFEMKKGQKK